MGEDRIEVGEGELMHEPHLARCFHSSHILQEIGMGGGVGDGWGWGRVHGVVAEDWMPEPQKGGGRGTFFSFFDQEAVEIQQTRDSLPPLQTSVCCRALVITECQLGLRLVPVGLMSPYHQHFGPA